MCSWDIKLVYGIVVVAAYECLPVITYIEMYTFVRFVQSAWNMKNETNVEKKSIFIAVAGIYTVFPIIFLFIFIFLYIDNLYSWLVQRTHWVCIFSALVHMCNMHAHIFFAGCYVYDVCFLFCLFIPVYFKRFFFLSSMPLPPCFSVSDFFNLLETIPPLITRAARTF